MTSTAHQSRQSANTPIKRRKPEYELPDTPTSLASSYNQDVIYAPSSPRASTTRTGHVANESRNSLHDDSLLEFTKQIKYNPLHDSIESFLSNTHHPNSSILGDFQDIKALIAQKQREQQRVERVEVSSNSVPNSTSHENESELIQKWLQDRNRWDTIQQSYEQKVADAQSKLNSKSLYFNKRIESMMKQEVEYQDQIKSLNQRIEELTAGQSEQYNTLHLEHTKLSQTHRELNGKYDDLQRLNQELRSNLNAKDSKISALEKEQHEIQRENDGLKDTNCKLIQKVDALTMGIESDLKLKTKGLNEELMSTTKELGECQQENERLKHLEMTSQSMVERLLKRLEQQIHSAEDVQHQLDLKEKEHETEILRLEAINEKLQKHLTVFNGSDPSKKSKFSKISKSGKSSKSPKCSTLKVNTKHSSPSSPCSTTSESSLFTLSTVMTNEVRGNIRSVSRRSTPMRNVKTVRIPSTSTRDRSVDALQRDLEAVKEENERLKESMSTLREMVDLDDGATANTQQHDEEWITRIKEMAKQTVLIEKLKNEMAQRDGQLMEKTRTLTQYETIIGDQKETIHSLEHNLNQQRQSMMELEKSNSDISMQLIEERTKRQKLNKQIADLEFENKQLRSKLIAFKNFASETTVDPHDQQRDHILSESKVQNTEHQHEQQSRSLSTSSPSAEDEIFAMNPLSVPIDTEPVGTVSEANTAHTVPSISSAAVDKELLDGLRGLLNHFSTSIQHQHVRPAFSAPNVLRQSSSRKPVKNRMKPQRESVTSSIGSSHWKDVIHRPSTSTYSASVRGQDRKRQRVSSLTPVSYLRHSKDPKTRNERRRRSTSLHQPVVTPSVHAKCIGIKVAKNPRKILKSKMKKAAKSSKIKSKGKSGNKGSRRNKSSQSASRPRVLKACIRKKQWA